MGLNIKNPKAHALAAELAALTGESLTEAVIQSLQERLSAKQRAKKEEQEKLAEDLLEIGRQCAAGMKGEPIDHGEFLYDERGLPK